MKILHLDTGETFRGGQQQVLFLMRGLRELHHAQWLITSPRSPLALCAQQEGFDVEGITTRGSGMLLAGWRIAEVVGRFKPDVLHFHDARAHGLGLFANRKFRRPVVVSRRVAFRIKPSRMTRAKYFHPRQRFIAVSRFIKRLLTDFGIDERAIDVVYDAVDTSVPPIRSREKYAFDSSDFIMGTVGALENEKGFDLLIRAIAQARQSLPRTRCIIAGSGSEQIRLNRLISENRLADTIQIIPMTNSVDKFIGALDLFVLPSRDEGLGSVLLLAMHCGTPVLASNAGGIPELVQHERTGFLFPRGSVSALAEMLVSLAEHHSRRNSVVSAAQAKVRSEFSIPAMTERTLRSYCAAMETL